MHSRPLAFAQLVRLPNVFTAFADICLGASAAGYITRQPGVFALMLLGSGSLYLAGMTWNDYFDRKEDAKTQPHRPIPSGRVSVNMAYMLGVLLLVVGFSSIGSAAEQTIPASDVYRMYFVVWPFLLVAAILLYDAWLKHTPFGPLAMGACRFLNVFLAVWAGDAASPLPGFAAHLAGVVGLYIVGVTWFARTEETNSQRWHLIGAAVVMAAAVLLGVSVPVHLEEGTVPFYYPYLLAGFAFVVGIPVVKAIRQPTPRQVQRAVKRCILGLVLLDAALATAFVGWPGLLIGLLLLPAAWLGKWVYST
jgi:4-hydroxybenzoate polyprenyltransferase